MINWLIDYFQEEKVLLIDGLFDWVFDCVQVPSASHFEIQERLIDIWLITWFYTGFDFDFTQVSLVQANITVFSLVNIKIDR